MHVIFNVRFTLVKSSRAHSGIFWIFMNSKFLRKLFFTKFFFFINKYVLIQLDKSDTTSENTHTHTDTPSQIERIFKV